MVKLFVMELSVVVPIFNEELIISKLYERLNDSCRKVTETFELIFINDGSKDTSIEKIKDLASRDSRVKYIDFSRNFGHQIAVSAGLDKASGKAVVIIDGDLQDPPELIPELYKEYKKGFKIVVAKRKQRKGESFFKKQTASIFYRTLAKITSFEIPLDVGDFRLIDQAVVEDLRKMPEANKFLRGQMAWLGYKTSSVEYNRDERMAGVTGYSLSKMLRLAIDAITSFSNLPLKLASLAGVLVSGIALLIILYALYSKFNGEEVLKGWTSLIVSSMFVGGIQLVSIGIIGEYISRINSDVKKRPLYVIDETNIDK